MNVVSSNPNAAASAVSGIGAGSLLVWVLSQAGVSIGPVAAAAAAGALSTIVLFVGRNGVKGIVTLIWRGARSAPSTPPPSGT